MYYLTSAPPFRLLGWLAISVLISCAFTPQNSFILFSGVDRCANDAESVTCNCPFDLLLLDPAEDAQAITSLGVGCHDPSGLSWSDNGQRIALRARGGIGIIDLEQDVRYVTSPNEDSWFYSWLSWAPNHEEIAYLAVPVSPNDMSQRIDYSLFVTRADAQASRLHSGDLITWDTPVWSPDGAELAFIGMNHNVNNQPDFSTADLYMVNIEDGEIVNLSNSAGYEHNPVWSRDGAQIAFSNAPLKEGAFDQNHQLFVMNANGSDRRAVTEGDGLKTIIAPWSPEGDRLIYLRDFPQDEREAELRLLDLERNADILLAKSPTIGGADWSPDGKQIVYSPGDGQIADICFLHVETNRERCLGVTAHWLAEPLWRAA